MPNLTKQEIENVIPGESMTKPKGALPFDKPPKVTMPEDGIQLVFDAITEPKSARKLIKTLKNGTPIDTIVESMMLMLHGEGVVTPQALPIMAPAMAAMIENMAKLAGVEGTYKEQEDPWTKPDEDEVEKLVAKMTGELESNSSPEEMLPTPAPEVVEEEGLMSRPVDNGGEI